MRKNLVIGLLLAAGCNVGPDYRAPATQMPDAYSRSGSAGHPTTSRATTQPVSLAQWWTAFDDPTLNTLIEQAIKSNQDLRIAESRVREARALRAVAGAAQWPTVDANGSYSRTRRSENISGFAGGFGGGTGGTGGTGGFSFGDRDDDFYQVGFDASWELDVFGGVRRSVEAANADLAASEENRRDVLVTLLSEVARNYIELRGLQRQRQVALANLETQRQTLQLSTSRFKAGVANELDVKRAEALVASSEATIPALEASIARTIHRLNVLEGRQPEAKTEELAQERAVPSAAGQVPLGLPSDLLRRRPDIRRAERELAASNARIGVATAELFPKFSLTGSVGLQSSDLGDLPKASSEFWSLGPSFRWPIFSGGRIRGNIRVQNARHDQALTRYEQTVLLALEDVENALINYGKEQERYKSLDQAVKANRRAVEMSTELYTRGVIDFLSVLEAQRSLFASEEQFIISEKALSANLVALYKALGGGWESDAIGETQRRKDAGKKSN
ncbi:MAG TPA: efflux transporter outer membrane subunit [Tepidisphaeraceae bacterium]|jgi:NodT family efflux transporter outer membrane factor (OMF) lipoprotein|nr:efflux transporter outer membrane subunit [Tepidisphaeraceae bacterium]